jgi:NADH:ubiquinone oxidoreductase subunit K
MNEITLQHYLAFSALLFAIGLGGVVTRRNAIVVLMGIELMLSAANLNFVAFWRFGARAETLSGLLFVLFSIGIAAAESAVGLALIIVIYRNYRTTKIDELQELKG